MTAKKTRPESAREAEDLTAELLSRIAAILIRLGLDSPRAERLLRRGFVEAALQSPYIGQRRLTQSKLASIAGLSRLEVRTILKSRSANESSRPTRLDYVVAGWTSDPKFLNSRGRPRPLDMRGSGWTFERLARKYGRDITARTLREELTTRGIAVVRQRKIALSKKGVSFSKKATAPLADLKFLVSHLAGIDFRLGRRTYILRQGAVSAEGKRGIEMMKRIAIGRLETVLNSLTEISPAHTSVKKRGHPQTQRLLITAIVATEAEGQES